MVVGPAILDDDVLALGEAGLAQALANRATRAEQDRLPRGRRQAAEKAMTGTIPPFVCGRATVGQAIAAVPSSRRSRRRMHHLYLKALRHLKYRFGEGPAKFSPPA